MMSTAKAWTFAKSGYPGCIRQTMYTPPVTLSATQIEVQIKCAALNPVDVQLMNAPFWSLPFLDWEKGIGNDFSGVVMRAGAEAGFKQGDEVFGVHFWAGGAVGTLAEVLTLDTKSPNDVIAHKPAEWSWQQAAAITVVWLTARTCMAYIDPSISPVGNGDTGEVTIAVLGGSSASGAFVVHLARQRGLRVIASCSGRNADYVRSMGADEVIDYTQEDVAARLRKIGPTAIVDCVGGTECIGISPCYVTIVGDKTSRMAMGGPALYLTKPRMVFRWLLGYLGLGKKYECIILEKNKAWLLEATSLSPDKITVDCTFAFSQLREAFDRLNTGRTRGKVVIDIGD